MVVIQEAARATLTSELTEQDGVVVWSIAGELDAFSLTTFHGATTALPSDDGSVIVDVSNLRFIDSRGLSALVGWIRRCHDRGVSVSICCGRPFMVRLLRMAGIQAIAPLAVDIGDALRQLGRGHGEHLAARSGILVAGSIPGGG
jgi:anti-sigma B factor antagonist